MKYIKCTAFFLIVCLLLAACSASSIPTKSSQKNTKSSKSEREDPSGERKDPDRPTEETERSTHARTDPWQEWNDPVEPTEEAKPAEPPEPEGPTAAERADICRAYAAFLQENKDITCGTYYFTYMEKGYNIYESIMFWDVTGDGLPEMLVIGPGREDSIIKELRLFIYTCENGAVKELVREDGGSAVPVFWDQTHMLQMIDSVCFTAEGELYVYSIQRELIHEYSGEFEELLKLGFNAKTNTVTAETLLKGSITYEYLEEQESHWYINSEETDKTEYEEAKAELFSKAEQGILIPLRWEYWSGSRAADSIPGVYQNHLGMRYEDALSFLAGEIEAAEDDPSFKPEIITLGTYEQDGNRDDGAEPIEWIVLAKEDGKALVISRYGLDYQYYGASVRITWENCNARQWLNGEFYNAAFSETEKSRIMLSAIVSEDNPNYGTRESITTYDCLFLLNNEEAERYMGPHALRVCCPTSYTRNRGSSVGLGGGADWLLRSYGGYGEISVSFIDKWGMLNRHGTNTDNHLMIRPAMWITMGD